MSTIFCCPSCHEPLYEEVAALGCEVCRYHFRIVDDVPDFLIAKLEGDDIVESDRIWLDPGIVEARNTFYRLCARELKGMAFAMQEISRRTRPGSRVLEVGAGTGHFTRWLAEVVAPGTEIYAFDLSWPIIERAKDNTRGLSNVTLFRANSRGELPFKPVTFDIVFIRLAPLGARGVPDLQVAIDLLRPGGWFFEAGWERRQHQTTPTEWAIEHGYASAEYHQWQYRRVQSAEEYEAMAIEQARIAAVRGQGLDLGESPAAARTQGVMTTETLLMAQKPIDRDE